MLLARALTARGWRVTVASFYGGDAYRDDAGDGVHFVSLGKRGRRDVAGFLLRLRRLLAIERPDFLYAFLTVPGLFAAAMWPLFPRLRIVLGTRTGGAEAAHEDWPTRLAYRLERHATRLADRVIANSEAGAWLRLTEGLPPARLRVIPNGIDGTRFRFDPEGRRRLRAEWDVSEAATLVGQVGRLHPIKDHAAFVAAAVRLAVDDSAWHFVCVGGGSAAAAAALAAEADVPALRGRFVRSGLRADMAAVYSAFDMAVSCSRGEGFPNAVAEAMACGRPCVATDVGESARIVGAAGIVVPPGDLATLADGIERLRQRLAAEGDKLGRVARTRIVRRFGVEAMARETASLLEELPAVARAGQVAGERVGE